jgi:soluble lytic murein transglycosylase
LRRRRSGSQRGRRDGARAAANRGRGRNGGRAVAAGGGRASGLIRSSGIGTVAIGALLLIAILFALSRIDFGETIREITLPLRHENVIRDQAIKKNVDADLIAAVIYAESRFRDQTSNAGARGLMQITPDTADTIETLSGGQTFEYDDLADPELNIRYGSFFLRHLLNRYGENEVAALAGYNAGITNADAWGGAEMTLDDIEFEETHLYVEQVLEKRKEYRQNYRSELGL